MKLQIYAILLLSFACTSILSRRRRTHHHKSHLKARTGQPAPGSWDNGFGCPNIWVALLKGILKVEGAGTFYPKRLANPISIADKNGICFKMEKISDVLKKLMVQDGDYWCFLYRQILNKPIFKDPWGNNKNIYFEIKDDTKTIYKVKVDFPYKVIGSYVTNKQGSKISGLIDILRTGLRSKILDSKSRIMKCYGEYIVSNKAAILAKGTSSDSASLIKKLEDEIALIKASIEVESKALDESRASRDRSAVGLPEKINQRQKLLDQITSRSNENEIMVQTKDDLSDKSVSANKKKNDLKDAVNISLRSFNTEVDTLRNVSPQRLDSINNAVTENTNLNSQGVNNNLDGIRS